MKDLRSRQETLLTESSAPTQGKKHAQRVRVYLQAKRAEKTKKEAAAAQVSSCRGAHMSFRLSVIDIQKLGRADVLFILAVDLDSR